MQTLVTAGDRLHYRDSDIMPALPKAALQVQSLCTFYVCTPVIGTVEGFPEILDPSQLIKPSVRSLQLALCLPLSYHPVSACKFSLQHCLR